MSKQKPHRNPFSLNEILHYQIMRLPPIFDPETGIMHGVMDYSGDIDCANQLLLGIEEDGFEIGIYPLEELSSVYIFEKGESDELIFGFSHPEYAKAVIGASLILKGIDPKEHGIYGNILSDMEDLPL